MQSLNEMSIDYRISPKITNDELNVLFANAWVNHQTRDFLPVLQHSMLFVCAYYEIRLVGFVNVAWDGSQHAFVLDTTVDREFQGRGIGVQLIKRAAEATKKRDVVWLHVDFEPHLQNFYEQCGFKDTATGLMCLKSNA